MPLSLQLCRNGCLMLPLSCVSFTSFITRRSLDKTLRFELTGTYKYGRNRKKKINCPCDFAPGICAPLLKVENAIVLAIDYVLGSRYLQNFLERTVVEVLAYLLTMVWHILPLDQHVE